MFCDKTYIKYIPQMFTGMIKRTKLQAMIPIRKKNKGNPQSMMI